MSQPPRIAFITANGAAAWGGSEELWAGAAVNLLRAGAAVLVVRRAWTPVPAGMQRVLDAGAQLAAIPENFAGQWPQRARRLLGGSTAPMALEVVRNAVLPFRPDLAVVSQGHHFDGREWMEACAAASVPFAPVAQAAVDYHWPSLEDAHALQAVFQRAVASFWVSHRNLELATLQLATAIPRAEVVRNPFHVPFDQEPGWPAVPEPVRLACVARLEPNSKGQDILFQVLARPHWRSRALRVSLFGSGRSDGVVRELARHLQLESVEFGGHVADVAEIWRTHHALVLPSRFEGLPLALVEAMLCHRPAIVTDVGGAAEVMSDGETGFLVPAPTPDCLDAALERAWARRADWPAMGRAAGARIRKLVPRDPCAAFADRLRELAAQTRPS